MLIGEDIPLQWNSTDGLVIYFGRNGIDIEKKKMVPLRKGNFARSAFFWTNCNNSMLSFEQIYLYVIWCNSFENDLD